MMALKQNFINTLQINYLLFFQMFMSPRKRLTPWMLPIQQESYLPYIKGDKKDIANFTFKLKLLNSYCAIYCAILPSCVIIVESNILNKNLSVISLELTLSFLLCIGLDIHTNSFTCFKLHIPISNLNLK